MTRPATVPLPVPRPVQLPAPLPVLCVVAALLPVLCVVAALLPVPAAAAPAGPSAGRSVRGPGSPDAQWQVAALRLPEAWRVSTGQGVLVAVLDTGVNGRHPDLAGAVVPGPDLTGTARDPAQWGHHGTAMASLIAGRGRPGGAGVVGVAPRARVLSVRVTLDNGDPLRRTRHPGSDDALARGIRYAADHGADVISMSLGGGSGAWEGSAAEEEAVQYAIDRGAVLVASSGNDGETANRRTFPAAYPGVIAVGAVDRRLEPAPYSNRQDYVSVVAPGSGIVTADGHDSYLVGDGTSSAAAMVAGIAALIRAEHPELSPYQVRTAIEQGARRRPPGGYSVSYGHGVADAPRALREAARTAGRVRVRRPATESTTEPAPAPGGPPGAEALPAPPGGEAGAEALPAPPPAAGTGPRPSGAPLSRVPVIVALLLLSAAMSARVIVRHRARRGPPT
jgi:type VII secretion-associated serine protease mycosin